MSRINPNLDFQHIKNEYIKNDKFVIVRDFLKPEYIEKLRDFYNNVQNEDWWSWMLFPEPTLISENRWESTVLKNSPENKEKVEAKRKELAKIRDAGGCFSYIYQRVFYGDHWEHCDCPECDNWKGFLIQPEMLNFLEFVSDHKELRAGELFTSRLQKGDWNGPHHDFKKGRVTIVLNLSEGFKPHDGGAFYSMEEDYCTIKGFEPPTFNSLVLFDVAERPNGKGLPHVVTPVKADKKRVAITGWYL